MTWVSPHTWTAGDDALSAYLQSMTDAILQLQRLAPSTGSRLDYFVGTLAAAQSIPNSGAVTPLNLLEELDDANGHSDSTNPSRYVPKNVGRLLLVGSASIAADGNNRRGVRWLKNGAVINGAATQVMTVTDGASWAEGSVTEIAVNGTTDYLELGVSHLSSTGSLNATAARVLIMSIHA